ncbi:MAG: septum formation protein Maf [Clostridiales bacterium]|nr:septum formation protein Maf [Clostridiales bacterium]
MSRIILASKSPRRFELLSMTGLSFEVKDAHVDEDAVVEKILRENRTSETDSDGSVPPMYRTAERICCALSEAKASAVLETLTDDPDSDSPVVIGSDTIVVTENEILGKPADEKDARRMLTLLSGKTHRVYTGVALLSKDHKTIFSSLADVTFHELDELQDRLIDSYIASGSPMDKAGAYGIQDTGSLLIDSICGDYYAVVGLPVAEVYRRLTEFIQP